ncbi:PAS domain-containing hybrid sensor histidine kinase/response regulator [Anaeromassilibacillus senegalensis]|uniref:PAS domain-containing hybrid sensor histidine kinase/response regulator n=1 Tax=Anaeromassilibacillus senegalensis TaxID=1673717 RepID=UPI0006827C8E|nr:response regulator [Anaeromassilibacillus senegalensis]
MIKDYANKVMDYEYNAFMTLMNVSVSKHLLDEHFTVLWANDYFYQLIGYTKEEYKTLFHCHVDEYFKNDPESVALMAQIIVDAYQRQQPGYEFECPMHVKNGGTTWIRVTGRFTDEVFEGVPVVYTIYTDITKLKELQQQLEEQSKQLSEALKMAETASRAKSSFLSQMSHDIRTPMNAIVGMTEIAMMHIDEPYKIKDCLKKISLSSQHLLGLINDVLDMSKIESGNIALNLEPVSLPSVLENIVAIMQPVVKEKKQHFSVRLQHVQHEEFLCDALRLRQIFINILSNASKFTPEGGQIIFEVEELALDTPDHARLRFTFSDTGIGIKPKFLPYLFDAFTRERDSRVDKTEGSGLGMAITKKLTELFGGTIQVQSRLGEGTTFCVELPLEITSSRYEQVIDCNDMKILVVDNDAVACEYLTKTLQELGADTRWCTSGADAVEKVVQARTSGRNFDIVLLDWQMPGMDGVQTARAIRAHADAEIPILIASAYDWSDIEDEAKQVGVNGFLQKPLFKSTLCSGIQRYLSGCPSVPQKSRESSLHGKRILLVEDNQLNSEIAIELLSTMGAEVETAVDGAVGVERFRQSEKGYFDLILMDVQMPNMNGYEATRQIRALTRWDAASVPIIAMTADAFAEDVEAARRAGMNSHLPKPFNLDSLYKEIGKYL